MAYRMASVPSFFTVNGAVTWSPGAILLKVTSAETGSVLMMTEPVVKLLLPTVVVEVNKGGAGQTKGGQNTDNRQEHERFPKHTVVTPESKMVEMDEPV